MKILIVDDDLNLTHILHKVLSKKYEVWCADSGEDARKALEITTPDIVLLDVFMPNEGGDQLLRKGIFGNIPVIIYTASRFQPQAIKLFRQLGAFDVLVKPVQITQLEETMIAAYSANPKKGTSLIIKQLQRAREDVQEAHKHLRNLIGLPNE